MPEAEERKQWVKRVMMGNRSEIKLKTKHHGEVFSFILDETFSRFYEISFLCNNKNLLFCPRNIKNTALNANVW